jgi:hypothetical protein
MQYNFKYRLKDRHLGRICAEFGHGRGNVKQKSCNYLRILFAFNSIRQQLPLLSERQ